MQAKNLGAAKLRCPSGLWWPLVLSFPHNYTRISGEPEEDSPEYNPADLSVSLWRRARPRLEQHCLGTETEVDFGVDQFHLNLVIFALLTKLRTEHLPIL